MSIDRRRLRWNGWGWYEAPDYLGDKAEGVWEWMGQAFGVHPLPYTLAKPLPETKLPPVRLDETTLNVLREALEPDRVKTDDYERAYHARGRSYHDLLYLRAGLLDIAPDVVAYPISKLEVAALIRFAVKENIGLIPFGGGSSVVGGVNAFTGEGQRAVITVDMTLMDQILEIDETALLARVQAGIYGPQLEKELQAKGFTLGHYPQSFEFSTLGGWIAPRSAGHQSNKYGKAEYWLASAEVVTPQGVWNTEGFPGSAAGPQLRDFVPGSEGVLGIITEATIRIHRAPEVKDYRGFIFPNFDAAVAANRELMQSGVPTAMIRVSDPPETFFYHALHSGGVSGEPTGFCLMLLGLEGSEELVNAARVSSRAIIERHGGMHMGESPGQIWYEGRFDLPYLRDPMMDRGLGVDTLETATRWSNLIPLHDAVIKAINDALDANPAKPGARGIVMSHVSHAYRDGASLYFTFAFPRALDREIRQWLAVKKAASDAVLAQGGTISHHHGIGLDHHQWLPKEKGPIAIELLRTIKNQLDPAGIMNPGKLI